MYGDKATELMRHITGDDHEIMPEYKHDLVEQVLKENDELYKENLRTSQSNAGTHDDNIDIGEKELMIMQVRHTAKLWNKRCIIAYHYERLNRLKKLRWDYGNNLPREIVDKLSKNELEWFTTYNNNLFSYMSALNDGRGLDLTLYSTPPKKLFIQVKCVRDYGQFDLEDGQPVMLKKDSIHYLPLSQCEKLIHQGVLEHTSLWTSCMS